MLTIVNVGSFSEQIHGLKVGDKLWVRAVPIGQGYRPFGKRILLAGGGYGVAPLLFLGREALAAGMEVHACTRCAHKKDVLMIEDFKAAGAHVYVTTDDGSLGEKGLITLTDRALAERPGYYGRMAVFMPAVRSVCLRRLIPCVGNTVYQGIILGGTDALRHGALWIARLHCRFHKGILTGRLAGVPRGPVSFTDENTLTLGRKDLRGFKRNAALSKNL